MTPVEFAGWLPNIFALFGGAVAFGVACAVPDRPTSGHLDGPAARAQPVASVAVVPGFQEDGSYLVGEDATSPAFLLSPPICTCTLDPRDVAGSTFGIPFPSILVACAEGDSAIEFPGRTPLEEGTRASNYRRVAECVATRVNLACARSVASVTTDPCPALLRPRGTGFDAPWA